MPPPDESTPTPVVPSSEGEPTPAPVPPQAPPAHQQAAPQAPRARPVVPITADRFAEMRKEERAKGQNQLRATLDSEAKALGYESHAKMIEAIKTRPNQQRAPMSTQPKPNANGKSKSQIRRERRQRRNQAQPNNDVETLRADNQRLTKQLNAETRKRRAAETARQQAEADAQLRESAARAGLVDIEYALHLIKRDPKVAQMTNEQRVAFDETKYFNDLRATHPTLFGIEQAPAQTAPAPAPAAGPKPAPLPGLAPNGPGTETAPKAGDQPPNGSSASVDARELTDAEYKKRLRSLGINPA